MKTRVTLNLIAFVAWSSVASAQEASPSVSSSPPPSPASSAAATATSPAISPPATSTPVPSASPNVAGSPARSARISFVPPPMEGTISLGIYDRDGKLVRVLVQEGDVEEFEVGADALLAKWDGKNDHDEDAPVGKYRARGYCVGHLKIEDMGKPETPPADLSTADHVTVKVVPNPLSKNAKLTIDLGVGLDEEQIMLKTSDGLPLATIIEAPQLVRAGITKTGEKAVDIWADGGSAIDQIRITNVDKMMAFDAGEIELK